MDYFETGSTDAPDNLAYEQYVFDTLPAGRTALGLWQNRRAVIVGRHQNTAEEVDADFVRAHGIQVVRRTTGGGAVYHDEGNLNFTYITDHPPGARLDFAPFTRPVIAALQALGVRAALSSRNDLCIDGMKFSGNAQATRRGRILHHGTLLFQADMGMISGALRPAPEKLAAKGVASVRARVTNIADHLPTPMTMAAFRAHLLGYLALEGLTPYDPGAQGRARIQALRDTRYDTWAWNWGASPRYTHRRTLRFPGGTLTAFLLVEDGVLREAALRGDFFAAQDTQPLEDALRGVPCRRPDVSERLRALGGAQAFIHGLDTDALAALLTE